jgi:4-hydroxy-tetrahydrodipicolinate synthase
VTRPLLISAVPTAFSDDGSLDLESTKAIFEHALGGGVDALFVNGTTAEFAALSRDERRMTLGTAVRVAGSDRLIAHVGAASPHETALLTRDAESLGITQLSVLTPFYMPASVDGVRRQVAAAQSAAPSAEIYLYLFPDRTGVSIRPTDAAALIEDLDLKGAKISIAGTEYLGDLVGNLSAPRTVLSGNDGLLREVIAAGGDGIVSGVSSSMPAPFARLVQAIDEGSSDIDDLAELVNTIVPVLGPSIAGLKVSLERQGVIRSAYCRMAIDKPDAELDERIRFLLGAIPSELTTSIN